MEKNESNWYEKPDLRKGDETNWWKPEAGKYSVTFTGEPGEEYEVTFEGKTRKKIAIPIKIGSEEFIAGITIGETEISFYGQLVILARKHDGLTDVTTDILVQGEGKARRYTIPEIIEEITETVG